MLPSILLLTAGLTGPSPFQVAQAQLYQRWDQPAKTAGRQPDPNGPNAIFLKYSIKPVPMAGQGHWVVPTRSPRGENIEKRLEEAKLRLKELNALIALIHVRKLIREQYHGWMQYPFIRLVKPLIPMLP